MFTLHPHSQFVDTVCIVREGKALFPPSPGEGNSLIAFTLIVLTISRFCGWGEEVKAKNEKRRTRA